MKNKLDILWNTFKPLINYYGLFEYIIIKSIGWGFLILGMYNFLKYKHTFYNEYSIKYLTEDIDKMNCFFYFDLVFIIIPILIGGLFLSKKNSLKSNKNE